MMSKQKRCKSQKVMRRYSASRREQPKCRAASGWPEYTRKILSGLKTYAAEPFETGRTNTTQSIVYMWPWSVLDRGAQFHLVRWRWVPTSSGGRQHRRDSAQARRGTAKRTGCRARPSRQKRARERQRRRLSYPAGEYIGGQFRRSARRTHSLDGNDTRASC